MPGFTARTGILYTIPSLAFFALLLPITGRGQFTAIIALTAYALQIIYRNIVTGLNNVPEGAKDAGRGMGMTAEPALLAGRAAAGGPRDRRRAADRDGLDRGDRHARLLAGGGGLGTEIYDQIDFKTNVIIASVLCVLMAIIFDLLPAPAPSRCSPPGGRRRPAVDEGHPVLRDVPEDGDMTAPLAFLGSFGGAFEFIFEPQSTRFTGGREVGGLDQVWEYTQTHLEISALALAVAARHRAPGGVLLGHYGKGEIVRDQRRKLRRARSPSSP